MGCCFRCCYCRYRLEAALDSKGVEVQRPVIRLAAQDVILTRIDPRDRASSMLVRLRPGWERFRTYLTEGSTSTRQRRCAHCSSWGTT